MMALVSVILGLIPLLEAVAPDIAAIEALKGLLAAPTGLAALAAITPAQWLVLAEDLASAAPQVIAALQKLGPAFAAFADDVKLSQQCAATNIHAWFNSNQPDQIPGYLADGSVGMIPNPNK